MPYRNYNRNCRRPYRPRYYRRPYTSRPKSVGDYSLRQAAYAGLKYGKIAMSVLNSEKKYKDSTLTYTPSTGGTDINNLTSGITQGDGMTNRDGQSVLCKQIALRMVFNKNASATATRVKWVLFIDKRSGSTPVWSDVFAATSIEAFQNISDTPGRFRILRSGVVRLDTDNPEIEKQVVVNKSMHLKFDSAGNQYMNNVWLMMLSDEFANQPTINVVSRVRFYDN